MIDHKKMWEELGEQLRNLEGKGVQNIHPGVVLGYMLFIWKIQCYLQELANLMPGKEK